MDRKTIASVFADQEALGGQTITVMGWARTIRDMKTFGFIELNDGSCFKNLQIVMDANVLDNYKEIAGQNVGARKIDRINQGLKSASIVGCIYCVIAFAVIFFFGKDMVSLFVDADDPAVIAEVLDKAHQFLIVNSVMYIPLLFVNIVRFTIQGVGFTTVAMTAGLMELIGRAGVAMILVPFFGFNAAVWANPAAWVLACAFLFPCYFTVIKWLRNRLRLTGQLTQSPKEFAASGKSNG